MNNTLPAQPIGIQSTAGAVPVRNEKGMMHFDKLFSTYLYHYFSCDKLMKLNFEVLVMASWKSKIVNPKNL